jgi:hypothetical protein
MTRHYRDKNWGSTLSHILQVKHVGIGPSQRLPDNTTIMTAKHPCPRRNSNPQSLQATSRKTLPSTARVLGSYLRTIGCNSCQLVHYSNASHSMDCLAAGSNKRQLADKNRGPLFRHNLYKTCWKKRRFQTI